MLPDGTRAISEPTEISGLINLKILDAQDAVIEEYRYVTEAQAYGILRSPQTAQDVTLRSIAASLTR